MGLDERPVLAHNMYFEGFICNEHADIQFKQYLDTMCMARAVLPHYMSTSLNNLLQLFGYEGKLEGLDATKGLRELPPEIEQQLAEYCKWDTDGCNLLFQNFRDYVPAKEFTLIDLTLRMFCNPKLVLDEELLQSALKQHEKEKSETIYLSGCSAKELRSPLAFADALRNAGVEPPRKISPTTGKPAYAFAQSDLEFLSLRQHPNDVVKKLVEGRLAASSNIFKTRCNRLLAAGQAKARIPVLLNYAGAHTFRWSGGNKLNFQNFPRKSDIRKSICAPPGFVILVQDLSQIEARLTAWFAGQLDVLQAYREFDAGRGPDIYRRMASKLFGKNVEAVTDQERFLGKICVLGLGYGMGAAKLKMTLALGSFGPPVDVTDAEAQRMVNVYRTTNSKVQNMWYTLDEIIPAMCHENCSISIHPIVAEHETIRLPNELSLKYPGLELQYNEQTDRYDKVFLNKKGQGYLWGGTLLENIIQALARIVIADQMLAVAKRYDIVSMTHDEIIMLAPVDEADEAMTWTQQVMQKPPSWAPDLPLAVDGGYDRRYIK